MLNCTSTTTTVSSGDGGHNNTIISIENSTIAGGEGMNLSPEEMDATMINNSQQQQQQKSTSTSSSLTKNSGGDVYSSDIQQHLQSMFYLLRPEETLKMVS